MGLSVHEGEKVPTQIRSGALSMPSAYPINSRGCNCHTAYRALSVEPQQPELSVTSEGRLVTRRAQQRSAASAGCMCITPTGVQALHARGAKHVLVVVHVAGRVLTVLTRHAVFT